MSERANNDMWSVSREREVLGNGIEMPWTWHVRDAGGHSIASFQVCPTTPPWYGHTEEEAERLARTCAAGVEAESLRAENERLIEAVRAAYWHLDTYGFPAHPDADLMASQAKVFELLRPFCPPIPGRF